ncbi:hypothetical protein BZA77DRAFT_137850 [Pyronema omphalodes]|nr:hypothetical protein BZA77DRAFT_137850 [Pyronema omphalodes]
MASVNGLMDGSTADGVPGHQFAPPAVERPKAAELFFMKSSDKKKLQQQQAEAAAAEAALIQEQQTRNLSLESNGDIPEAEATDPKTKPSRKPKAPPKKPRAPTKGKKSKAEADPTQAAEPTSEPILNLPSSIDIDPITAAAAPLIPSLSVQASAVGGSTALLETAEADFDLNPRRSKRQKTTPPKTSPTTATFRMSVDNETGMILHSSSPIRDPTDRMSGLILESELGVPPTSPILPAARTSGNVGGTFELPLTPSKPSGYQRTWASYNKKTHIFTVHGSLATSIKPTNTLPSSPPPQPVVKNAFSLLGKKKVELPKKPAVKEPKEFQSDSDMDMAEFKSTKSKGRKVAPRKTQKKEVALPPQALPLRPPPSPPPEAAMVETGPAPINPMFNIDPQLLGWQPLASINPPPTALTSTVPPPENAAPAPAVKKAPHPFFSASGRKKLASTAEPAVVESTLNAGPAVAPTVAHQAPPRPPLNNNWALSFSNTKADAPKIPGMKEPAWPIQGSMHVRGLSPLEALIRPMNDFSLKPRKLKDTSVSISPSENILHRLASRLQFSAIEKDVESEDYATRKYFSVPSEVRLPTRHIITSSELQDKVRTRVNARLPHPKALTKMENPESDSDSNGDIVVAGTSVHPALLRLYKRLGTEFTAFDFHQYETVPWEVKYAPQTIAEILQPGNEEKKLIRNWLIELQTDNVTVKGGGKGKRKAKGTGKVVPKKKRKKKNSDLDGFVVDGESEANIMDDITDVDEDDWLVNPTTKTKKSTVRSGDKVNELQEYLGITKTPAKKTNTIVISGPTGCGKTAAVYAVAKELGFHVFEVFSGMKRSGKDIQEQVGDMSRNHLVHQRNVAIESNNPFAKAKAAKSAVKSFEEELQTRQKQSLILFEEVDVLFEEDKGFWSAVISLMAESKRPIVLTCNDESQIPWDDLQLHAILRFSLPPSDILVDYLLLMAANEGHLLNRKAIYSLMLYNGNDIRACIMNLQFYCCMAVGDRRAGLDWMIDRSSAGKDIGANGEKLRVVSEDTYYWGMGLAPNAPSLEEDEKWRDVWDEHHLDIGASAASEKGLEDYAALLWDRGADKITSLDAFCNYYDSLSAADAFSSLEASGSDLPRLDPTPPPLSLLPTVEYNSPIGYKLLQTELLEVPASVEVDLATYTRSLSRRHLGNILSKYGPLPAVTNRDITNAILSRDSSKRVSGLEIQSLFSPLSKADTISASTPATIHSSIYPSVRLLTTEVAPWVRSILRYDVAMEKERRKGGRLLGGRRKTRAARLATEGGSRGGRKERWFAKLGADVLTRTGNEEWLNGPDEEEDAVGEPDDEMEIE